MYARVSFIFQFTLQHGVPGLGVGSRLHSFFILLSPLCIAEERRGETFLHGGFSSFPRARVFAYFYIFTRAGFIFCTRVLYVLRASVLVTHFFFPRMCVCRGKRVNTRKIFAINSRARAREWPAGGRRGASVSNAASATTAAFAATAFADIHSVKERGAKGKAFRPRDERDAYLENV